MLCSPLLREHELAFELEDSGAKLLIALEPARADVPVASADDLDAEGDREPVDVRPGGRGHAHLHVGHDRAARRAR